MTYNQPTFCRESRLKVYDLAQTTFINQEFMAQAACDLGQGCGVVISNVRISEGSVTLEHITITPVPCRQLVKRVRATACARVFIEAVFGDRCGEIQAVLAIPIDVLVNIPDIAPYELEARLSCARVLNACLVGQNIFSLWMDAMITLFVLVTAPDCGPSWQEPCPQPCPPLFPQEPCRPLPPPCPPICLPQPCPPACPPICLPQPCPPACPPICLPQPCPPRPPICLPEPPVCRPRPPVCRPKPPCPPPCPPVCGSPPIFCLPLYPK